MADHDETIDLRTLQEVQRLLATTDFASADDLAGRADPRQLSRLADAMGDRRTSVPEAVVGGAESLPRRR